MTHMCSVSMLSTHQKSVRLTKKPLTVQLQVKDKYTYMYMYLQVAIGLIAVKSLSSSWHVAENRVPDDS